LYMVQKKEFWTILPWFMSATIDAVWICKCIYWPLIHHSERQVITALSLISTLYKLLEHAKFSHTSLDISWQRLLTVEILQRHALTPLPAGHRLATELPTTDNWSTAPSLLSLPWRVRRNCRPSTDSVPGWRPFHTGLLVFSSQADIQLTTSQSQSHIATDGQSVDSDKRLTRPLVREGAP
jgi:hypothetical protein